MDIRLVKYKANSSNSISKIYFAVDKKKVDDISALRVDRQDMNGGSYPVVSGLVGGYKIADGMMELSVPKTNADMKNADNYKLGEVVSSAYAVRENGSSRNFVVGEFDKSGVPTILINYTASADALASMNDLDTAGNNPIIVVDEVFEGVDEEDNPVYTVNGYNSGAEVSFTTTKSAVLGKLNASGDKDIMTQSPRAYSTKQLWNAQDSSSKLSDFLSEGDIIIQTGGDKILLVVDVDDLKGAVLDDQEIDKSSAMPFGAWNPYPTRNAFTYGPLLDSSLDAEARMEVDAASWNVLQFDAAKLMDTIEITKDGKVTIDTEGSTIADVQSFDAATETGDYVFARFADKGSLQEIVVYRFVN